MSLNLIAPMCYRNHAIRRVLDHFLIQIKIRNGNDVPKCFLNVSYYHVLFVKINFLYAIFKTKFSRRSPKPKDKITEIKQIPRKLVTTAVRQFSLMRQFSFFRQFLKLLATKNTCIFVNIARKMKCDISKSKLILCEWNAFYFIKIAFIGFTLHEIKRCIVFFGTPGI